MQSQSHEARPAMLTMLQLLALGARQIEQGKFRSVAAVLAEMDEGEACPTPPQQPRTP